MGPEVAVAFKGFLAMSLVKAAIQKQAFAADLDQVHGTGCGARGSVEGKIVHYEFFYYYVAHRTRRFRYKDL